MRRSTPYSSALMLMLLLCGVHLMDITQHGALSSILALDPSRVVRYYEVWRLVSYPFASANLVDILIPLLAIFFFGIPLERSFRRFLFTLLLGAFTVSCGLMATLIFWDDQVILRGAHAQAFFLMSLALGMYPKEDFRLFGRYRVRPISLVFMVSAVSFALTVASTVKGQHDQLFHQLFLSGFGLFCGFSTSYIAGQLRSLRREARELAAQRSQAQLALSQLEEFDPVYHVQSRQRTRTVPQAQVHEVEEELSDEERLNLILDKMLDQGNESISMEEREFLEEYSRRI